MIVDSDSIRLLYIVLFVHPVETGCIFDAFLMGFDGAGDGARWCRFFDVIFIVHLRIYHTGIR